MAQSWTIRSVRRPLPAGSVAGTAFTLRRADWIGLLAVLAIAVGGLAYVKWVPAYDRAFSVAASHSLGASIVSGRAAAPPPPSLAAAIDYALEYFGAIWKAMALGLLLAASVETLLPRDWLCRVLGSATFRHTALGGALALPGMM